MKSRSLCSLPATGGVEEVSPCFHDIEMQGVTVHAKSAYAYACFACAMYVLQVHTRILHVFTRRKHTQRKLGVHF
jgi:hypothetical protein